MNVEYSRWGVMLKPQNDLEAQLLEKLTEVGRIEPIRDGMGAIIATSITIPLDKFKEASK